MPIISVKKAENSTVINVIVIIISMVALAKYGPDYSAFQAGFGGSGQPDPIVQYAWISGDLPTQVNGAANMVRTTREK